MVTKDDLDREILEVIDSYLREVLGEADPRYDEDTDLVLDLRLDSLDFVALLAEFEERCGVDLSQEDTSTQPFATIGSTRQFVRTAVLRQRSAA